MTGQSASRRTGRGTIDEAARRRQAAWPCGGRRARARRGAPSPPRRPCAITAAACGSGRSIVFWALLVPGLIAFSGLSARLRNLARRVGRWWFLTVGLYVVLLPGDRLPDRSPPGLLRGFRSSARLRAVEPDLRQVAGRRIPESLGVEHGRRLRLRLGSLSSAGPLPAPVVAVHGRAFGAVPVRARDDQADLDRSPVQRLRAHEEQGRSSSRSWTWPAARASRAAGSSRSTRASTPRRSTPT